MAKEDMKDDIFTINQRNKEKAEKEKMAFGDEVFKDATDFFKHKNGGSKTFAVAHIPGEDK